MSKYEELKSYLPSFITDIKEIDDIYKVLAYEFEKLQKSYEDLVKELSPLTCTWSIGIWEEFVGIDNSSSDLEYRRMAVISKMSMVSPVTKNKMINLLKELTKDIEATIINYYSEYLFELVYKVHQNSFTQVEIDKFIEEVKPAHLDFILRAKEELYKENIYLAILLKSDVKKVYVPARTLENLSLKDNAYMSNNIVIDYMKIEVK